MIARSAMMSNLNAQLEAAQEGCVICSTEAGTASVIRISHVRTSYFYVLDHLCDIQARNPLTAQPLCCCVSLIVVRCIGISACG